MSRRTPDPTGIGIGLAFAGMLLLTLTPVAGRWADVPPALARTALGAAILLMLAGAAVGLLAGREGMGQGRRVSGGGRADRSAPESSPGDGRSAEVPPGG